ncbi:hypothetical protein ABN584_19910 [Gloeocapsa sp. BRSZ]|uniref:hypothetical protein n=1 Tax=Cyanophyceae TaxID=3028117 RepID=UPI001FEEF823|nr:hypothetical protein [Chroococcidiopsis sp. TS-821]
MLQTNVASSHPAAAETLRLINLWSGSDYKATFWQHPNEPRSHRPQRAECPSDRTISRQHLECDREQIF